MSEVYHLNFRNNHSEKLCTKAVAVARRCLYYFLDPQDKSSIHKLLFEQFLNECTLKWINLSQRKHVELTR